MKLLLVMPTGLQVGYDEYFSSSPLGIETLAAHAQPYADVALLDVRGRGHDVEAHAELILSQSPDMVGVSVNSAPHTKYAFALAQALRRRRGDLRLIVGGQQASFLPEEFLADGRYDALIRGEGELTLEEILQRGAWQGVLGVSWRQNGSIRREEDRPLIADLDEVRPPARSLLPDRSRYRMGEYRVEGIETSRGCAHHCSFCSVRNFHRGKWRPKSVARVMREIDSILETYPEPKVIYFADDNFSQDIRRIVEICKAIIERKSQAYFWCQARVDQLSKDPSVIEWMGKAHFAAVLAGIETPIPRLLAAARKGINLDQVHKAIELLHQHDIGVWGTFTLGLPGETPEESAISARFIEKTPVDVAQITVATPIPGSTLYDEAKANGDIIETDWDKFDFTSPTLSYQLPKARMDALMHRAYFKTYTSWRFLRAIFSKKTNLHRLRRTAFFAFGSWIRILVKERIGMLFGRRPRQQ